MEHVFVVYPGKTAPTCQNCGKTESKAAKTCPGPAGAQPKPAPDLEAEAVE